MPYADHSLIPIPNPNNRTEPLVDYVVLSDIFPTGWTGLDYAGFQPSESVSVFGAGPVGLMSIYSAILRGASMVYAVDRAQSRLDFAESMGAIPINFAETDPVEELT